MRTAERLARIDRVQHTLAFKIAATIAAVALAVAAIVIYAAVVTGPAKQALGERFAEQRQQLSEAETLARDKITEGDDEATQALERDVGQARSAIDESERVVSNIVRARTSPAGFAAGVGVVLALHLVVIWIGLGLTYLAIYLFTAIICAPLYLFEPTRGAAMLLTGVSVLTAAFAAMLQAGKVALSAPSPVAAVARNTLSEAVRMKISLVFIVLIIFGLAALPGLLNSQEELRYRVQSFLSYAIGGTYALLALLTVFFSVATVSSEQRTKVIWQTATKPVAAWQYILGKWLGIVVLNAAMLGVCGAGIFMFTEYLRSQPAMGERAAFSAGGGDDGVSEDRVLLETRVLAARRVVHPSPTVTPDDPEFIAAVDEYIKQVQVNDPDFANTQDSYDKTFDSLYRDSQRRYRTIGPGQDKVYVFEGLEQARDSDSILALRFSVDAGSNQPDQTFRLTFLIKDTDPIVRESILGFPQSMTIGPWAIQDGRLEVRIVNGDIFRDYGNPLPITFPDDGGLELSYSVGGFRMNFVRVVAVLWLKLAFLAMVGVFAATFLSFPVASLIAVFVLISAEGAAYLVHSLESWALTNRAGDTVLLRVAVSAIATAIARSFQVYAELKPTTRLVDGLYLSWSGLLGGMAFVGAWIAVLYGAAVWAFRRRELAIYSGS